VGSEIEVVEPTFAERKVLIVGGGVTGGAVARAMRQLGALPAIVDEREISSEFEMVLSPELALAQDWDLAVISPGWRQNHPFIVKLRAAGVELISEVDLAWKIKTKTRPTQKWLAVTGTNGKTTTVEMVAAIMRAAGKSVAACGNLGDTVIEAVIDEADYEYLVLELSSFQLQWSELPEFAASAILNIADDHVDWHGTFDDYVNAKLRILERSEIAILNGDDANVLLSTQKWEGKKVFFTLASPRAGELGVVEDLLVDRAFVINSEEAEMIAELAEIVPFASHSVLNSLAAAGLALSIGVSHETIREAIRNFRPGRHRIETVLLKDGVRWVNDSKATNPHAALASLGAFTSVIWIAGGLAKGAKMQELISRGKSHIRSAILIGEDRELIAQELEVRAPGVGITRIDQDSGEKLSLMERVVLAAKAQAQPGDVVLLAPACASMDQFISYADRGDQFCAAVGKLAGQK
jgi:UDP-N-acetylmuramoylalanine--D-glutamate ligase